MQTKEKQIKQNGVSMIVLLITIVVMIILATISILTISNQDTITKAKEVKIKEDISTFKTDFNSYIDEKKFEAISVGQYYDEENDEGLKDVRGYSNLKAIIPSMLDSYGSVLAIKNGKLTYIGNDEKYKTIMEEMGIEVQ